MVSRRQVLAGLSALPFAGGIRGFSAEAKEPIASLNRSAAVGGRYFGSAVRIEQLEKEAALREEIVRNCGWLTPEVHLKWNSIENRRGQFWFEPIDKLVAFAARNGMQVHGHTLLWEQSTPDWAKRTIRRDRDWRFIDAYFQRVMTRYGTAIPQWDVVNELIDTQSGDRAGLRRNIFHRAFGADYIPRALECARRHAPHARLMINDYSFEYENRVEASRRRAFLTAIERLRKAGTPLDGVGIQAHLDLGKGPLRRQTIAPFLREIADHGLSIVITELDVKERDYRASPAERDRQVADEAARYLDIVMEEPAVEGVVTWGISDRHSWLQVERGDKVDRRRYGNPAPNRGLPFDMHMQAKPMHAALARSLAGLSSLQASAG